MIDQLISDEDIVESSIDSGCTIRFSYLAIRELGEIVVPKTTYCCFKTRDHVDDDSAQY